MKVPYLDIGRNSEALSPSALASQNWPKTMPDLQNIPIDTDIGTHEELRQNCLLKAHLNRDRLLAEARAAGMAAGVLHILNHRAFQFNSRSAFANAPLWRDAAEAACKAGRPVALVLPIFCIIANPAKRFEPTLCTLAEKVTLSNLLDLALLVRCHYAPGLVIHIIADASFYAPAFGNTSVEAAAYFHSLKTEITRMKAEHILLLHDMSTLLSTQLDDFTAAYVKWHALFEREPAAKTTQHEYQSWLKSMCACLNIKKYGLNYEALRQLYTALPPDHLLEKARQALAEYRAVKAAAADLQWEERFFPNAIRATIHSKTLPVLGLRLYPEYKRSSRWLPYHGIALIQYHPRRKHHIMTIEPEMIAASRPAITRLVDRDGHTMGYLQQGIPPS